MTELADTKAREAIRTRLDKNLVVEAAAGTGKTTELMKRIIAVIGSGKGSVRSLVAVTFTEKAAGELKLRLRAGLEEARQAEPAGSEARKHLEAALSRLEEARVSTIHGFCADLLRERPIEAGVDPHFRVTTESEAEQLYSRAFNLWLQQRLENPTEGIQRSLRRKSRYDDLPTNRLRLAGWTLADWRDFPAPWRRAPFDRKAEIDGLVARVHEFADMTSLCGKPDRDNLFLDTLPARRLSQEIRRIEEVRDRDHDWLEAELVALGTERNFSRARRGSGRYFAKDVERSTVRSIHEELLGSLRDFVERADADLAAVLQVELQETVAAYERLKQRSGALDFVDLLIRARNLLRDCDAVRAELQARFTHVFVDEFQDTDPLQAEILLLLASSDPSVRDWRKITPTPGKLFIVGDPKQSIYRFRRADIGTYLEVRDLLIAAGAERVDLTTSFRATPSIQRVVNTAFADLMTEDFASQQARYVPLSPYREDRSDQPSIIALPVPRPYGTRSIAQTAIESSLPDAVAAYVHWLIEESHWTVAERDESGNGERFVPIAARHICLLFRRFDSFFAGDITRGYIRALEARGIPSLLVGGKSFHEREEVETMRAALAAIEWPDDQLSVFATLRGSLFAIADEELLEYRHRYGRFHPFRVPQETVPEHLAAIPRALELLASLHRGRNHRPVSETVALLLEATRAHAGFALRPGGDQVLANVLRVGDLAQAYETSGGISFRAFVDQLSVEANRAQTGEAPILEEGSDGVRIMTVHKAKGLEFPVVVLADITARMTGNVSRYIDRDGGLCAVRIAGWSPYELNEHEEEEAKREEAESLRLAYVAATRARDLLVVPTVGDRPFENGWVSCLNAAVYPERKNWRRAKEGPACPKFGNDSVIERPLDLVNEEGVQPGLHTFSDRGYGVVWWDPGKLTLNLPSQFGIRQQYLLGKEPDPKLIEADIERFNEWQKSRQLAIEQASVPTLNVQTATEYAKTGDKAPAVQLVELPREERPSGPRFGALVHATLATVPLAAEPEAIENTVKLQARILGATAAEAASAVTLVTNTLDHPLMKRADEALRHGKCRRETPITLREDNGALVEGVVDLAFEDDDVWYVVDFKTDGELQDRLDSYRRQVGVYASAISAATGKPASAILMQL